VVDFEATNDGRPWKPEQSNESYPSEIIQFPAVLIDGSTAEFVKLHTYIYIHMNYI